jgi:hypothetical protein
MQLRWYLPELQRLAIALPGGGDRSPRSGIVALAYKKLGALPGLCQAVLGVLVFSDPVR